jgi:ribosomal protein S18 acetylase RimI-like enzyme
MTPGGAFRGPAGAHRPEGLSFTAVTDQDWEFLCQVYVESREDELAPVPWPDAAKRHFLTEQFGLQRQHYATHYQGAELSVVRMHGQPVGRVYLFRGPADLRLMEVAVTKAWRRRGLCRAMLLELVDESDQRGIQVSLHVEPLNPIVPFYRSLGFTDTEDRGAYTYMVRPARHALATAPA